MTRSYNRDLTVILSHISLVYLWKKNHHIFWTKFENSDHCASVGAGNQFQDYQDLSTSGRGARCTALTCYNHGKCIEKRLKPICECDMTSFTGPSCADGKKIGRHLIVEHSRFSFIWYHKIMSEIKRLLYFLK